MKTHLKHILVFFSIALVVASLAFFLGPLKVMETPIKERYELRTIKEGEKQWYYEVYENTRLLIRQRYIPATTGSQYFRTQSDAERMGNLVIQKLNTNQSPSISLKELCIYEIAFKQ